jgi:hypothetical protein
MPERTTSSAGTLEGRIDKVRVAVPPARGAVHFLVDGAPVLGTIEDADQVQTLRNLQDPRTPVRIGVLTGEDGISRFSWLIGPKKIRVPPRFYADERRMTWWFIAGGLALAAIAGALIALLGIGDSWRAVTVAVTIAVGCAGLVLAGVGTHGLWRMRLRRAAILHSEALYRDDDGRPAKAVPAPERPALAAQAQEPASAHDDEQPGILRVAGSLKSLTYEMRHPSNSQTTYGIYRFLVGNQSYVMTAAEDLGKPLPFLAEGDQVELAAYAGDAPAGGPHKLVYALRNLEDGRVYVCHRIFRGGDASISPVGVGMTQRAPLLKLVGGFLLVFWLMLVGIFYVGESPSQHEDLPQLAAYAFVGLLLVWGCCAMPFVYLNRRWRGGRPTRRQRILERIYASLTLGTPFAPTGPVEEV